MKIIKNVLLWVVAPLALVTTGVILSAFVRRKVPGASKLPSPGATA